MPGKKTKAKDIKSGVGKAIDKAEEKIVGVVKDITDTTTKDISRLNKSLETISESVKDLRGRMDAISQNKKSKGSAGPEKKGKTMELTLSKVMGGIRYYGAKAVHGGLVVTGAGYWVVKGFRGAKGLFTPKVPIIPDMADVVEGFGKTKAGKIKAPVEKIQ